jgi:hypothetical protein
MPIDHEPRSQELAWRLAQEIVGELQDTILPNGGVAAGPWLGDMHDSPELFIPSAWVEIEGDGSGEALPLADEAQLEREWRPQRDF